ncbi:type IX secretion system protein PorQ [Aureibacter tunicatorum]|uniref:Type IX secretion system protein PorQ n=1 Tax=Aureibacter tunicatorum TaxID=866807 RepID=A0AAE3XNU8_9BACT|nr:type IX secretion system protein PorQ [Aureibacter tunicatorum]MDR6239393.1 hypothetical protein [Aureibacter tunicatorum]
MRIFNFPALISTLAFLTIMASLESYGQSLGGNSFDFLNVPSNATSAALGGVNITKGGNNIDFVQNNPSSLNDEMLKRPSINMGFLPGKMTLTNLAYGFEEKHTGLWAVGMTYINYGKIDAYDPNGTYMGEESARDYVFSISKSHQIRHFRLGASIKFVGSNLAGYSSSGLAFDLGGQFVHPDKDLVVGLMIKNAGFVLSQYTESSDLSMALDVQAGFAYKPEHMPFRFTMTIYNLTNTNDLYNPENETGGASEERNVGAFDQVFSHVVIGGELLISKPFKILLGYNHKIKSELRHLEAPRMSGFAFGFNLDVRAFHFAYGHGFYNVAGGTNYVSLSLNMNRVFKKNN